MDHARANVLHRHYMHQTEPPEGHLKAECGTAADAKALQPEKHREYARLICQISSIRQGLKRSALEDLRALTEQVALSLIPFVRLNFSVSSFWINCLLVSMFRLPKSVCTNIVDHFVCWPLQLMFGFYRIDHLKCLIESKHRRLAKPLTPPTFWR